MNLTVADQMGGIAFLLILWGLFVTIFYMVVAWRAMRAHERIARALERMRREESTPP